MFCSLVVWEYFIAQTFFLRLLFWELEVVEVSKRGRLAISGGRFFQFLRIGWVESKNACQQSRRAQKNRGSVFWSFIDSTDSFRENWIFVKKLRKF